MEMPGGRAALCVLLSAALSLAIDDSVVELDSQPVNPLPAVPGQPAHSDAWHCKHCGQTCSTDKCKQWCQKQHCKQDSPLFKDTSVRVPPGAGDAWKCQHCRSVCKTAKCNSWCKKFHCAVDADGNAMKPANPAPGPKMASKDFAPIKQEEMKGKETPSPPAPVVKTARKPMDLLSISKRGSHGLQEMERKANTIITQANKDTTGKMLRAAGRALEAVLKQREHEATQFKKIEQASNERDKKRYSKKLYRKWSNEKAATEGIQSADMLVNAKEKTAKDNAKEIKFKAQSDQESEATADTDAVIAKETANFEKEEAVAAASKAAGVFDVDRDHAEKMKQNPGRPVFHLKNKNAEPSDDEGDKDPAAL